MDLVGAVLSGEPFTVICFLVAVIFFYGKTAQCKRHLLRDIKDDLNRALITQKNAFTSEVKHARELAEKDTHSLKKLLESKINAAKT